MKYAVLFAAVTAFLATAVRAEENIAVEEASQELIQSNLAKDLLEDLSFNDRKCCERKPECFSHCRCRPGQILVGRLVEENGAARQEWKCVDFEEKCEIRCKFWDGYAGFCLSNKQESRPKCNVPVELFNALPTVISLPPLKTGNAQEQLFDLFTTYYLTFGKNGFGFLQTSSPLDRCGAGVCCDGRATCVRRIEFEPFNIFDLEA